MKQNLAHIAIVIEDYDQSIEYFTKTLLFDLIEDTVLSETKRWVIVRPQSSTGASILLAKAANDEQKSRIGNQTGGRVFLFLHTTDFDFYYNHLIKNSVKIVRQPVTETWGKVAVFEDIYGNLWDLIEKN